MRRCSATAHTIAPLLLNLRSLSQPHAGRVLVCSCTAHTHESLSPSFPHERSPNTLRRRARPPQSRLAACPRRHVPCSPTQVVPVVYACRSHAPGPNRCLNRAPEHQIRPSPVSPHATPPRSRAPVPQRRRPARGMFPRRPIQSGRVRLEARTPLIRATRSRSDGRYPRVPLQPGTFAKETLGFP